MIGNFTEVKPLRYWVQHILPLVYDDSLSYMELLSKVINTLNEVVKNNNLLPDYIMELIKEYISSGEIEKVLAEILANYMLNVKFPPAGLKPATGNGSADDTEAIQGCIDYAYNNGGMSVYFPSGSYLTQPLTLRNKATLFGQDRYTTRLVMKGGATTAMFTGDVDELTLTGLGFDGNMDIQVNNVNLFTISVNSAIITNCLLTDGYELLDITVNYDLQLNDVIFKHAVENALVLKGAGVVQGNNLIFKSVSALVGKNFVVMDVSKSILEQLKCYGASPNAVLINGNNNVVKMWNEQSLKAYTDNGANNTVEVYTQSEQKKLTGFKTTDVSGDLTETVGGNKSETITGNKGVNVHDLTETVAGNYTKTVTGDISKTAKNFKTVIQLAYELTANSLTEQLTSKKVNATNSTETITGEKEVNANGSTENIANEKHVIAGSVTENITGDKHVNTANSVETIQGDKTVTAGDISETAVNKTVHITKDSTEQTDGTRTLTVAGDISETSANRTINVTNNREVNVNGSDSVHIDGMSTLNVQGQRTEVYAGDKTESVTGTETGTKNIVNETVNNLNLVGNNELKFKSNSLVLDSNGEPIKLGINVIDDLYYGTIKVRGANGNVRELMVKNNGTPNLARKHGFNTKNVVIIGDSFAGTWYSGYTSYAYLLKDLLNIETLHVYSIGGAGYVGKGNLAPYENVTYQEYIDSAFDTEMSTYANDVTLVIVQGGGNDYKQEYGAERTAVKNLITDIKSKFPNADVYGVSGFWLHNMFSDTKNGIINGYNESGVPLFNHSFYTFINHTEYFAADKLHPNELGMTIMANAIANDILYGIPYDCNQGGFIPANGGGFVWQITSDGLLKGYVITTETETVCAIPKTLQPAENDVFGFAYTGSGAFVALWYNNGALKIYAPQGTTATETKGSISWFLNANDNNATG